MGKYLRAPERSCWVLSENGMVNRLWSYHSFDIEDKNVKKPVESGKNKQTNKKKTKTKTSIFKVWNFSDGRLEPN